MIKTIIFDVDNTLYSSKYGLEDKTSLRIRKFAAEYLNISIEEAVLERSRRIMHYGTTLEWLMAEKNFEDIEAYYRFVHPGNEVKILPHNPELKAFLDNLACKRAIMTNAPIEHAMRVLKKLGIEGCFCEIFDIRRLNFKGKPRKDAFRDVLSVLNTAPNETLFIDDIPRYVESYNEMGGRGILFDENNQHKDFPGNRIANLYKISKFL